MDHSVRTLSKHAVSSLGAGSLFAWQIAALHPAASLAPSLYNNALALCLLYLLAGLSTILLLRSGKARIRTSATLIAGAAASASLMGAAATQTPFLQILFIGIACSSIPVALAGWGAIMGGFSLKNLVCVTVAATTIAALLDAGSLEMDTQALALLQAAYPLAQGVCAKTLDSPRWRKEEIREVSEQHAQPPLQHWLGPLVFSCLAASFFIGLVLMPYGANSLYTWRYANTVAIALGAALLAWAYRIPEESFNHGFLNTALVAMLAILLCGLFLFASGIAHVILPLGIVVAANAWTFALLWIAAARTEARTCASAGATPSLLYLLSGHIWMPYLGMACNRLLNTDFSLLSSISTACIAALAVFFLIHLVRQARPSANQEPSATPSVQAVPANAEEGMRLLCEQRSDWLEQFQLTERETQVALALLDNMGMKSIADELCITERTVKFHAANVYRKAEVTGKQAFIAKARSALLAAN